MYQIKKIKLLLFGLILFLSVSAKAEMKSMDEDELSQVTAQAGVTSFMDVDVHYTADNIKYSDSNTADPDWIEFQGFSIDDGNGNPFSITVSPEDPITIDVATFTNGVAAGKTYVDLNLSQLYAQPRYYHINNLVFCGQNLGRLDLEGVRYDTYHVKIGNHKDGTSGIDFDYTMKLDIDRINFAYNNNDSLSLSGIHFSESASGNPEDPSSWTHNDNFKIGNIKSNNPGTFDIGTSDTGETVMFMSLPMEGSIRVNDVSFGGTSFGPIAIDGLQVHRMGILFSGN